MKLTLAEKCDEELVQEYEKLVELEQTYDEPKDRWEQIWLKAVKARRAVIEMALKERQINIEEV